MLTSGAIREQSLYQGPPLQMAILGEFTIKAGLEFAHKINIFSLSMLITIFSYKDFFNKIASK